MARPPLIKQDLDLNWEKEFESEEGLRSQPLPPEGEAQFGSEEDLRSQHFQPAEEIRSEKRPPPHERYLPERPDTKPERRSPPIWQADKPRKMGRISQAASLVLLVLMAFSAGWLFQRNLSGPTTAGGEIRAANESSPSPPAPAAPGADAVVADRNEDVASKEPIESASADLPDDALAQPLDLKSAGPAAPSPEEAPRASTSRSTAAPPSTPAAAARQRSQPPPQRRLNLQPPARPPYRSIPEPSPSRPANAESKPPARIVQPPSSSSSPVTPPPSPPAATNSPSPAAATSSPTPAVETPAPLARVAVNDPELRPPATPPSEPATAAPSTARPAAPAPVQGLAPPAAASSAAGTVASAAADVDTGAIRDVLGRYRNAFNALDASAAQQVWPTVNQRTLDRAFGQLQEQSLSFNTCTIAVKGALADAVCSGTTRFVPAVGNRAAQTQQRQWSFSLRKGTQGGWLIQNVEAR